MCFFISNMAEAAPVTYSDSDNFEAHYLETHLSDARDDLREEAKKQFHDWWGKQRVKFGNRNYGQLPDWEQKIWDEEYINWSNGGSIRQTKRDGTLEEQWNEDHAVYNYEHMPHTTVNVLPNSLLEAQKRKQEPENVLDEVPYGNTEEDEKWGPDRKKQKGPLHKLPVPEDRKSFVAPGHHFLGPGNKITDDKPVDSDDAIAREHDRMYEKAQSAQDIQAADNEAVGDFFRDFLENGNVHSLAASLILGVKQFAEGHIGVQYPSFSGT